MDKSKTYRIVNALDIFESIATDKVSESAKHRIGRVGKVIRATKGMGLRFAYGDSSTALHTSKIQDIKERGNYTEVYTLNTLYVFEVVEGEE